jgi:hypothetical protein
MSINKFLKGAAVAAFASAGVVGVGAVAFPEAVNIEERDSCYFGNRIGKDNNDYRFNLTDTAYDRFNNAVNVDVDYRVLDGHLIGGERPFWEEMGAEDFSVSYSVDQNYVLLHHGENVTMSSIERLQSDYGYQDIASFPEHDVQVQIMMLGIDDNIPTLRVMWDFTEALEAESEYFDNHILYVGMSDYSGIHVQTSNNLLNEDMIYSFLECNRFEAIFPDRAENVERIQVNFLGLTPKP